MVGWSSPRRPARDPTAHTSPRSPTPQDADEVNFLADGGGRDLTVEQAHANFNDEKQRTFKIRESGSKSRHMSDLKRTEHLPRLQDAQSERRLFLAGGRAVADAPRQKTNRLHYEAMSILYNELVFVSGDGGRQLSPSQARRHFFHDQKSKSNSHQRGGPHHTGTKEKTDGRDNAFGR